MGTIVAIGAHHDDVELRSGGTLAKYLRNGWHVTYVVATTTPHYWAFPEEEETGKYRSNVEAIELRKEEARKGATTLGISDINFFDFKSLYWYKEGTLDRRFFDGHQTTVEEFEYLTNSLPGREFIVTAHHCPAAVSFLCDFLRSKKADIVLTHFPEDGHWEHYATARFVCASARKLLAEGTRINLYAWEQGGAGNMLPSFAPSHFVDISETIDLKCSALRAFVSQFPDHNPEMFATRARKKAKEYGALCGMQYAEPFMKFDVEWVPQDTIHVAPTYDPEKTKRELEPAGEWHPEP